MFRRHKDTEAKDMHQEPADGTVAASPFSAEPPLAAPAASPPEPEPDPDLAAAETELDAVDGDSRGSTPSPRAPQYRPEVAVRRNPDIPGPVRRRPGERNAPQPLQRPEREAGHATGAGSVTPPPAAPTGKVLHVGEDICLNGEITACDSLLVEGTVEAQFGNAHTLEIRGRGLFKGTAEVARAVIDGTFEGELTVTELLEVHANGAVRGALHYRRLVMEDGGRISGTIGLLDEEEKS